LRTASSQTVNATRLGRRDRTTYRTHDEWLPKYGLAQPIVSERRIVQPGAATGWFVKAGIAGRPSLVRPRAAVASCPFATAKTAATVPIRTIRPAKRVAEARFSGGAGSLSGESTSAGSSSRQKRRNRRIW